MVKYLLDFYQFILEIIFWFVTNKYKILHTTFLLNMKSHILKHKTRFLFFNHNTNYDDAFNLIEVTLYQFNCDYQS